MKGVSISEKVDIFIGCYGINTLVIIDGMWECK